ncbi:MAG: 30S ribosomal protein S12 methylthiotransferase RimO [Deltaproteobacteria bacterium]|nr:30S ribosomal protein S12 methylthiotransferase RimO [Deltaproteobacteria bacterium]
MDSFNIVSLGCPKNLVDSEYIVEALHRDGFHLAKEGKYIIVNTCAFIEDAIKESIETILKLGEEKQKSDKILVVTGCLVERYKEKLAELLPEVDLFVGRAYYSKMNEIIRKKGVFVGNEPFYETFPRRILTTQPVAYLKIQEGCDNMCTYCTIPKIRGPLNCRRPEDIVREFKWLIDSGYKEINIIGQDITAYGKGLNLTLKDLLSLVLNVEGDYYLRLLYLHPKGISDDLLDLIAKEERIIKYIDMPIQHSEDRILSLMGRGYTKQQLEKLLEKIRTKIPEVTLRTTVMVGFPSETEEEFEALLAFIESWGFDMLGAFMYSREEGTIAYKMKGQLTKKIKRERLDRLMTKQRDISRRRLARLLEKNTKVIVEDYGNPYMIGRILNQAPEVDGIAFIKGQAGKGKIVECKIIKTLDYDVVVEV